MERNEIESGPNEIDLSEDFLRLPAFDFLDKMRELRKTPSLKIYIDLSELTDKDKFVIYARRLKAFLENTGGQKRSATIRVKCEQISWEPNVFCSGVKTEKVD